MTHKSGPPIEKLKFLGTTWCERGFAYWVRRVLVTLMFVFWTVTLTAITGAIFYKIVGQARGEPGPQLFCWTLFGLLTFFGAVEGWINFHVISSKKRDYTKKRDQWYAQLSKDIQILSPRSNPSALTNILTFVMGILAIFFGAGMFASVGILFIVLSCQKYAAPEEFDAVMRVRDLEQRRLRSEDLPVRVEQPYGIPVKYRNEDSYSSRFENAISSRINPGTSSRIEYATSTTSTPEKVTMLGRSWVSRG